MSTTREIAQNIARLSLPFSAFRNESEWKDTTAFLTNTIDKALQAERERLRDDVMLALRSIKETYVPINNMLEIVDNAYNRKN